MRIYKPNGTSFWHYEFVLNGKRYHKSTKMTNEREALKVANAAFTTLVKGEGASENPSPFRRCEHSVRTSSQQSKRKSKTSRKPCSSTLIRSIRY